MDLALALLLLVPQRPVSLEAELAERSEVIAVRLTGNALTPRGTPARGALVTTSAGGEAVAQENGSFELSVELPLAAESVEVTAVRGASGARSSSASIVVPCAGLTGRTSVGTLHLLPTATCRPLVRRKRYRT